MFEKVLAYAETSQPVNGGRILVDEVYIGSPAPTILGLPASMT
jgi:hypothetical protein